MIFILYSCLRQDNLKTNTSQPISRNIITMTKVVAFIDKSWNHSLTLTHFMPMVSLYPLKTSVDLWFSDIFRWYKKKPVARNGSIYLLLQIIWSGFWEILGKFTILPQLHRAFISVYLYRFIYRKLSCSIWIWKTCFSFHPQYLIYDTRQKSET